jgi:hypothetical protein
MYAPAERPDTLSVVLTPSAGRPGDTSPNVIAIAIDATSAMVARTTELRTDDTAG